MSGKKSVSFGEYEYATIRRKFRRRLPVCSLRRCGGGSCHLERSLCSRAHFKKQVNILTKYLYIVVNLLLSTLGLTLGHQQWSLWTRVVRLPLPAVHCYIILTLCKSQSYNPAVPSDTLWYDHLLCPWTHYAYALGKFIDQISYLKDSATVRVYSAS